MFDKFYVGQDVLGFENTGKHDPISRVTLFVDENNYFTAGDDSGKAIEANCPSATQEMANAVLAAARGFSYQSFTADAANIDPAAELGDGATVGGIYSILSQSHDDGEGFPDISAPGERAIEEEFPMPSANQQYTNRKIAQTRSYIEKTAEEINLVVEGLQDEFTKVSVTLDGLTVTDQTGTTLINGSLIETTNLHVQAANIDGTLKADQIVLTGSISWGDLDSGVQNSINSAGGISAEEATTLITNKLVSSPTIQGALIKGGYFSDLGEANYLTMFTNYGATGTSSFLNHYCAEYSGVSPLMSMGYYEVLGAPAWGLVVRDRTILHMNNDELVRPLGVWDFSGATVTGLSVVFG